MSEGRFYAVTTVLVIVGWLGYAVLYLFLKSQLVTASCAAYFPMIGETSLDILAAGLAFNYFKGSSCSNVKNISLLLCVSFVAAFLADCIYNILLNFLHFQYINPSLISLFDIPFLVFLFLQAIAWGVILLVNKRRNNAKNSSIQLLMPYILVSILIFGIFMFGITWKIQHFSLLGLFQVLDTALEAIGFALTTLCLARANTKFIRYVAAGYLLIISSDFIIRYHVVMGSVPYLSTMETTWVLGLLLICLGFFFGSKEKAETRIVLSPVNSLQSQIAIWLLILWLVSVGMFVGVYCIFSHNTWQTLYYAAKTLMLMIIPFSALAIISSSYIAAKISYPLAALGKMINHFSMGDAEVPQRVSCGSKRYIAELITLEDFVCQSFLVMKEQQQLEMSFAKSAAQVVHDIRSPLSALGIVTKNIMFADERQRNIISACLIRINEIAENLLAQHRHLRNPEKNITVVAKRESLIPLMDSLIHEKKLQHDNTSIDILYVPSNEPLYCKINVADFKRVMSNLVNNAIESIVGKGQVSVLVKKILNNAFIEIKDTGCGFPQDVLNNIKEGASAKTGHNGLGLQHAIACIKEWNSSYEICSEVGKGTSFIVKLPIQEN